MVYYSLPTCRLRKKTKTKELSKTPANYESRFYKTLDDSFNKSFDTYFQRDVLSKAPNQDVKNYLLPTSDFGKGMQDDINMYVTRDRLNNASFRQKLDCIAKNIFRRQNPLELVFKNISTFDAQNPIIRSLLREIDVEKKDIDSKLFKKAPNVTDVLLKARLDPLKRDNDDNNIPPPTPPPTNFPSPTNYPNTNLPPSGLPPDLFQAIPPPPPSFPPTYFSLPANNNEPPTIGNVIKFGEIKAVKGKQELPRVENEIDALMKSIPSPPRLELDDEILNVLKDAENVINNGFVKVEENDDKDIQRLRMNIF